MFFTESCAKWKSGIWDPTLKRWREDNQEFKASLRYVKPGLKTKSGVVALSPAFKPSPLEAKSSRSLLLRGLPGFHSKYQVSQDHLDKLYLKNTTTTTNVPDTTWLMSFICWVCIHRDMCWYTWRSENNSQLEDVCSLSTMWVLGIELRSSTDWNTSSSLHKSDHFFYVLLLLLLYMCISTLRWIQIKMT